MIISILWPFNSLSDSHAGLIYRTKHGYHVILSIPYRILTPYLIKYLRICFVLSIPYRILTNQMQHLPPIINMPTFNSLSDSHYCRQRRRLQQRWRTFNSLSDSHSRYVRNIARSILRFQFPIGFSLISPASLALSLISSFNSLSDSHGLNEDVGST